MSAYPEKRLPRTLFDTVVLTLSSSLIQPLHYHGDFRPYFTIYDVEYPLYCSRSTALPATIVGVTNPCFVSAFEHWPNLVRVASPRVRPRKTSESSVPAAHSPTLAGRAKPGALIWTACVIACGWCLCSRLVGCSFLLRWLDRVCPC
jgi:hypothetical protein